MTNGCELRRNSIWQTNTWNSLEGALPTLCLTYQAVITIDLLCTCQQQQQQRPCAPSPSLSLSLSLRRSIALSYWFDRIFPSDVDRKRCRPIYITSHSLLLILSYNKVLKAFIQLHSPDGSTICIVSRYQFTSYAFKDNGFEEGVAHRFSNAYSL